MKNQWLMIKQLDQQLQMWKKAARTSTNPRIGWIKAIRLALNMTADQFAIRLGVKRARVNQLEKAEVNDAVTLRSLRDAADALGCEVVYAIVPKNHQTLEDILRARAQQIAKERIARVSHSMALEAQTIDKDNLKNQQEDLIRSLLENLNKKFWSDKL